MSSWTDPALQELFLQGIPLIDVRAPVEFAEGAVPHSVNLPLLDDEERRQVGLCYKAQGQEAAIQLGHVLVQGDTKTKRITAWLDYLRIHPQAQVFCFRGGLRSQISCEWIGQRGHPRAPIPGGYKRMRRFFLSWLEEAPLPELLRLGGRTGSGKTELLVRLPQHLDLEGMAHHRGSAFGSLGPQPTQATFENRVASGLLKNPTRLLVEDESATLGKLHVPRRLFSAMAASPLVVLTTPLPERVENIFQGYVLQRDATFFLSAIQSISRKLGGLRARGLSEEVARAFQRGKGFPDHEGWITSLLTDYYDPLYDKALKRHQEQVVFQGGASQVREWWENGCPSP